MIKINEEDVEGFKRTANSRLSPESCSVFIIGTIIYTSIVMIGILYGLLGIAWKVYPTVLDKTLVKVEVFIYGLQWLFLLLLSFPKLTFKFQKLQSLVILLFSFQLATIGLVTVVIPSIFGYSNDRLTLVYVGLLILGALLVHILSITILFSEVKNGKFSLEGKPVSILNKMKHQLILGSFIYVLVLTVLIYINNYQHYTLEHIAIYLILSAILYTVAFASAEFQLLAYCRYKFPSFYMRWEEQQRNRFKYRKKKHKQKSI